MDVAFSTDSRQLAFANVDVTSLDTQVWQAAACRVANRSLTDAKWVLYFPGETYRPTCVGA